MLYLLAYLAFAIPFSLFVGWFIRGNDSGTRTHR